VFSRRKNRPPVVEPTFRERVGEFWRWFGGRAEGFQATIADGRCGELTEEVAGRCSEWFPGFGWVFGPGQREGEHSFTLTGEGCPHRRLLAMEWCRRAPEIDGWQFHPARRRAADVGGHSIRIGGKDYRPIEFWVTPTLDEERERIDLVAWNPVFESMPEPERYQVLFLWLDEVLGEEAVADRLGAIEIRDDALADSFPVPELAEFVDRAVAARGWRSRAPGEHYELYQLGDSLRGFVRDDTVAGTSRHMSLIHDYLGAGGRMEDPLIKLGASFVFVSFETTFLGRGKEVADRAEIEDLVGKALAESSSGYCLGGALGRSRSYIDLLVYDRHRSWNRVLDALRGRGLPAGTRLHPFAEDPSRVLAEI